MTPDRIEQLGLKKMDLKRMFTFEGKSPFEFDIYGNPIKWLAEDVRVTDDMGKPIFTQPAVRRPDFWSPLAIKVVASKYFWGDQAKGERENSVEKIIGRVSRYIGRQAFAQKYFNEEQANILRDEIAAITLNQLCVFNSPVWFNAGIWEYNKQAGGVSAWKWDESTQTAIHALKTDDRPQCSACFILSTEDNMESILKVQVAEAILFKAGSGTGTNRSPLRSSKEKITGGGKASGPVSFMKGYDAYANIIKSGGKTRRAAKMEILNVDHPDIMEFVLAKQNEEKKAWALIEQGYSGGMNGDAYSSIFFQNCNMSVRVTDQFMQAVKEDGEWQTKAVTDGRVIETFKAREIMRAIAEGTHLCGDPGIQCDGVIQKYHTSKNSGRINATNPCSEYLFLDDTACNLASINLMKFLTPDGNFDVQKFKGVVRSFITAMDIIVDGASYPTAEIAERSHIFRTLGLGYANLGALLMSLGLPYDSDEGRAVAAAITAIMCGEAYKTSAEIAALMGPFPGFQKNRESMLEVMNLHREHVREIQVTKMPIPLKYLVNEAWDAWTDALEIGEKFGYRNAQTTVLAPTGTIAFMMDCDTTGIEPDIALVKYKVLSGGGMLKIVNRSVPIALATLGYSSEQIQEIIQYIDKNDTIEGAPWARQEHLPVFDCAFKPAKGKRAIHYKGHIKMMAVTQPFISGAISKTVNLPEQATVDDIMDAYIFAWEQSLKAVAIYRENSKRSQPLNTQKTEGEMVKKQQTAVQVVRMQQQDMPQTRKSITHRFEIAGHKGYLTVGLYDEGRPGEIFVTMSKEGSTIRGLMDAWAASISLNLQYGIPVEILFNKFRHQKFEPSGFVRNTPPGELDKNRTMIRTASSIIDYVAQFMITTFGKTPKVEVEIELTPPSEESPSGIIAPVMEAGAAINLNEEQKSLKDFGNEGLVCPQCGSSAKRMGNCAIYCPSCKQTTRSGCGE
ncbi:MAG: vitamin B12-dependent ribonucleotide reductase [Nanoarchaeota archaeon]